MDMCYNIVCYVIGIILYDHMVNLCFTFKKLYFMLFYLILFLFILEPFVICIVRIAFDMYDYLCMYLDMLLDIYLELHHDMHHYRYLDILCLDFIRCSLRIII